MMWFIIFRDILYKVKKLIILFDIIVLYFYFILLGDGNDDI